MGHVLEVDNIVKQYGKSKKNSGAATLALAGVSFFVDAGEFVAIMGPSGSGKSTLLNCISTIDAPTSGSIRVAGRDVTKMRGGELAKFRRDQLGFIFQDSNLLDTLTVRENIDYFCSLYVNDRKRRRALVDEAIDFVGLGDFTKFRPGKLSGGLARRLNIACGIAHKPELIFFDEPTVAVDPQSRNAILEGICRLRDEGATVVYTSHYMEEVEQICSRIMIMDGGRVLAQGTNDELKRMIQMGEKIVIEVGEMPSAALGAVASLPHVLDLSATAGQLTFSCEASPHNLTDILDALRSHDVALGRIYSEPPTLNDVFLEITGRELRD